MCLPQQESSQYFSNPSTPSTFNFPTYKASHHMYRSYMKLQLPRRSNTTIQHSNTSPSDAILYPVDIIYTMLHFHHLRFIEPWPSHHYTLPFIQPPGPRKSFNIRMRMNSEVTRLSTTSYVTQALQPI
jgi:hypothetical protein